MADPLVAAALLPRRTRRVLPSADLDNRGSKKRETPALEPVGRSHHFHSAISRSRQSRFKKREDRIRTSRKKPPLSHITHTHTNSRKEEVNRTLPSLPHTPPLTHSPPPHTPHTPLPSHTHTRFCHQATLASGYFSLARPRSVPYPPPPPTPLLPNPSKVQSTRMRAFHTNFGLETPLEPPLEPPH